MQIQVKDCKNGEVIQPDLSKKLEENSFCNPDTTGNKCFKLCWLPYRQQYSYYVKEAILMNAQ